MVKAGASYDDICEAYPAQAYCQQKAIIYNIQRQSIKPEALGEMDNLYIWGDTGVGKSHYVHDQYPGAFKKSANKWWDGYAGEDTVYIEDVPKDWVGVHVLKNWADKWPFPAEVKGSSLGQIRPKKIIITSNYCIHELSDDPQIIGPLLRRFKVQGMFKELGSVAKCPAKTCEQDGITVPTYPM